MDVVASAKVVGIMNAAKNNTIRARYGDSRNTTFSGKVVVVVLSVIFAAVLAYMVSQFMQHNSADVKAQESGGEVVNEHLMRVSLDVTRSDSNKAAYCIVTALDYEKNEVGRREFVVPAGGAKVGRYKVDVQTRTAGYAGKAYGCSAVLPDHLNPAGVVSDAPQPSK